MLDRIHALGRFVGTPGLHRICAMLEALGNPQKQLKFIHIVGTNGKGSTANLLASALQQNGYRVGLFTSPYLVEFGERIRINGQNLPDDQLQSLGERVFTALDQAQVVCGEFEFVMALGMLHFAQQNCDIVVLETGLGGEFDATNVIDTPELLLFTSISLDHTAVLGNTVSQIAHTKAQTVKPHGTVIDSANQHPDASAQICAMCDQMQADYVRAPMPQNVTTSRLNTAFSLGIHNYTLGLLGEHQAQNAALAVSALDVLAMKGWNIDAQAVQIGLRNATHAGRLECICNQPYTILDGAHNEGGVGALCQFIQIQLQRPAMVIGMVSDKAVDDCMAQFARVASVLYITEFDSERAIPAVELCEIARKYHVDCRVITDASQALATAQQAHEQVVVAGSLYLVGALKKQMRESEIL